MTKLKSNRALLLDVAPWKRALRRDQRALERLLRIDWEDEQRFFAIERRLIWSAFSMRRILETRQLFPRNLAYNIQLVSFKHIGIDRWYDNDAGMNISMILENFDIYNKVQKTRSLRYLMNQIVHSFILLPIEWKNVDIAGFAVCSDFDKNKELLAISWDSYFKAMNDISSDDAGEP